MLARRQARAILGLQFNMEWERSRSRSASARPRPTPLSSLITLALSSWPRAPSVQAPLARIAVFNFGSEAVQILGDLGYALVKAKHGEMRQQGPQRSGLVRPTHAPLRPLFFLR